MKKIENWNNYRVITETAAKIVEQRNCSPDQVKGYEVSKALGMSKPNGQLYKNLDTWKREQKASTSSSTVDVPVELIESIGRVITGSGESLLIQLKDDLGRALTNIQQAADYKVALFVRRAENAEQERAELLDLLTDGEAERDLLHDQYEQAQTEADKAQRACELLQAENDKLSELFAQLAYGKQLDAAVALGSAHHEVSTAATSSKAPSAAISPAGQGRPSEPSLLDGINDRTGPAPRAQQSANVVQEHVHPANSRDADERRQAKNEPDNVKASEDTTEGRDHG